MCSVLLHFRCVSRLPLFIFLPLSLCGFSRLSPFVVCLSTCVILGCVCSSVFLRMLRLRRHPHFCAPAALYSCLSCVAHTLPFLRAFAPLLIFSLFSLLVPFCSVLLHSALSGALSLCFSLSSSLPLSVGRLNDFFVLSLRGLYVLRSSCLVLHERFLISCPSIGTLRLFSDRLVSSSSRCFALPSLCACRCSVSPSLPFLLVCSRGLLLRLAPCVLLVRFCLSFFRRWVESFSSTVAPFLLSI